MQLTDIESGKMARMAKKKAQIVVSRQQIEQFEAANDDLKTHRHGKELAPNSLGEQSTIYILHEI